MGEKVSPLELCSEGGRSRPSELLDLSRGGGVVLTLTYNTRLLFLAFSISAVTPGTRSLSLLSLAICRICSRALSQLSPVSDLSIAGPREGLCRLDDWWREACRMLVGLPSPRAALVLVYSERLLFLETLSPCVSSAATRLPILLWPCLNPVPIRLRSGDPSLTGVCTGPAPALSERAGEVISISLTLRVRLL